MPNRRVAAGYLAAALLCALLAVTTGRAGLLLLWPALACAVTAAGYLWLGGRIYAKRHGQVAPLAALLLAPVRLGQWLSWLHYRRQSRPWDLVLPGLWIGRVPTAAEAAALAAQGVQRVLDLTAEFSAPARLRELDYLNLPLLDLTAPTPAQLERGVAFIRAGLARGEPVYVYCKAGYSRSAALVGAALLADGRCASTRAVVRLLRTARPMIVLRPETRAVLRASARRWRGQATDPDRAGAIDTARGPLKPSADCAADRCGDHSDRRADPRHSPGRR